MTDLVQRLREISYDLDRYDGRELRKAADEIERLRGVSDGLIRALDAEVERQRDEIERLRAVLRSAPDPWNRAGEARGTP